MTRGPEQGRPPEQIYSEAQTLADQGCLEITLLGQTVNSYRYTADGKNTRLADLLHMLHDIQGIQRIKFVTNFPKDMTVELLKAVRDLPKVSPYLHVPLQSGSNDVLARMKRGYTVEDYREMMERIDTILPQATVSSDFIVGFCGETEADFEQTKQMVRECRFKNSFVFKYSERAGTKAAERIPDDVPYEDKQRRNNELLEIQNKISEEDNLALLGRTFDVLIEGPSKLALKQNDDRATLQLTGRTHCDRIVVFEGMRRQIGQILPITIHDATAHTLFGGVVTQHVGPDVVSLLVQCGAVGLRDASGQGDAVKRAFFLFFIGFAVVATVGYLVWLIFDSLRTIYRDWRLARELDELEAWSREKRRVESSSEEGTV
jgi:tRNA-2-methylthio-N6-dimethylallyladenosine synthase